MLDFVLLAEFGVIGFYESCEVTQVFLYNKKLKSVTNAYVLACFEEKPFVSRGMEYVGKPYPVSGDVSLCMRRYGLTITEARNAYEQLQQKRVWDVDGDCSLMLEQLKLLPKQFVPSVEENRLNHALKNNFHAGSYIIEFFDETKRQVNPLLDLSEAQLKTVSDHITAQIPIDLSIVRDRIGNIIFQFPVTVVEINTRSLKTWDGIEIQFGWHSKMTNIPDCEIEVEASLDKNFMAAALELYNKKEFQQIVTGNSDPQNHIRVWRKHPALLIYSSSAFYIKGFNIDTGLISHVDRQFEVNGKMISVPIAGHEAGSDAKDQPDYRTHIQLHINNAEKKALAERLAFKQYHNFGHENALQDLQNLISTHDANGAYLWDPFLTAEDLLKTLFYSKRMGVELKAIGSINKTVRQVYNKKGQPVEDIIKAHRQLLDNPKNNNLGLNLEFRMQFESNGWPFHDRFLIFPGSRDRAAQVYSLGTSINSFGMDHHILQEVAYPQPLIDAFHDLWDELNKPECIVWKFPAP